MINDLFYNNKTNTSLYEKIACYLKLSRSPVYHLLRMQKLKLI